MSIITLTTDYGNKDYFVSSLKAKIVSEIDSAKIIDISHDISPFNLTEAGYILEGAHKNFPKGTIHMICVDSELTPENKHIVIKHEESFFIGADNGVFSLIFKDIIPENIFEINLHNSFNYKISSDDLFVKVLGHILRSGPLNVVGSKINKIKEIKNMALDLAKMKAKLQELEGGAKSKKDNVFWKPTEGDQDIRIVPTSDGDPFKVFHFHYNLGEAARGGVLCPKRQFGEHCPICEFASSLWQEESSESKKMA